MQPEQQSPTCSRERVEGVLETLAGQFRNHDLETDQSIDAWWLVFRTNKVTDKELSEALAPAAKATPRWVDAPWYMGLIREQRRARRDGLKSWRLGDPAPVADTVMAAFRRCQQIISQLPSLGGGRKVTAERIGLMKRLRAELFGETPLGRVNRRLPRTMDRQIAEMEARMAPVEAAPEPAPTKPVADTPEQREHDAAAEQFVAEHLDSERQDRIRAAIAAHYAKKQPAPVAERA